MADELGISASYLNHLERNSDPVTAGILLRLAEAFDVDVKSFASEAARRRRPTSSRDLLRPDAR
jgi:transcriptional regulator with XRE-family HTH domain